MTAAILAIERALPVRHDPDAAVRRVLAALLGAAAIALVWKLVQTDARIAYGAGASLAAGLATAVGAMPIFTARKISQRAQDTMLGFGTGVMLAATSFSLIMPGVAAETLWGNRTLAAAIAAAGMLGGALFLWAADRFVPHEHFVKGTEGADGRRIKQVWLFVFAITLHNFPEGLAVGVAFGAGQQAEAVSLTTGIGIQNMPEGLAVALALAALGYTRIAAFAVAAATGLAEPLARLLGAVAVTFMQPILPFALTFAAGAMLFVISHEIIPESHRHGHEQAATLGVTGGFVTMMLLDTALG
jgi:ZIP family zinc transporter